MELLPTEILQKILSDLSLRDRVRVERVCKRWKNVSTSRIWRDVRILTIASRLENYDLFFHPFEDSNKSSKVNTMKNNKLCIDIKELGVIQSLVSRAGQHVKEFILDPDDFNDNTKPVLSIIATYCHNIESIQLGAVHNSSIEVISTLLQINTQLHSIACCYMENFIEILPLRDWKSLSIEGFLYFERKLWENKVVALIENSPSLEKFCVHRWTLNIVRAISRCEQLTDLFFPISNKVASDNLMMDASLLNRLTCLRVERGYDEDDLLINLLRQCKNLESLHLSYRDGHLSDEVQEAILDLPKLESLALDDAIIDDFLNHLLKIKDLKLVNCWASFGDYEILEMIKSSECLEKLEILDMNVSTNLFERLTENVRERRKILKIRVEPYIYEEALKICKGSGIHIITELDDVVSNIRHWLS